VKGKQVNPELRIAAAEAFHKQGVRHLKISEAMQICAEVMREKGIDEVDILTGVDKDGNIVVKAIKDSKVVIEVTA